MAPTEFWELGHELFRTTPETCPIRFVPGDVFADAFLDPSSTPEPTPDPIGACVAAGSLNPLGGRTAAVHASSFFHLFNEVSQAEIVRRIAALLDPAVRDADPLLSSSRDMALIWGRDAGLPPALVDWTDPLFPDEAPADRVLRWKHDPAWRAALAAGRCRGCAMPQCGRRGGSTRAG